MRIACAYLPSFPLQLRVREAPHLAAEPLAVTRGLGGHVSVAACSRAAWDEGVRPGMRVATAVTRCRALQALRTSEVEVEAAALSVADVLSALSDNVEVESARELPLHLSVYFEVPPRVRGAKFGESAITLLSRYGYRARVGVADDRFTAYVAACAVRESTELFAQTVTAVPRGGSAAFLAPHALDVLPLNEDVRALLGALGIRTLGAFAALPPPTIASPRGSRCFDLQDLARGEDTRSVASTEAPARVAESSELCAAVCEIDPLAFALRPVSDRVAARLDGRGLAATRLRLTLSSTGDPVTIEVRLPRPTASPRSIVDAARRALRNHGAIHNVSALELAAVDLAPLRELESELPFHRGARVHRRTAARTAKNSVRAGSTPVLPRRRRITAPRSSTKARTEAQ